jgi:hypothetical protein
MNVSTHTHYAGLITARMAVKDWVVVNPFGVLRSTVNPLDAPDVEGELRCGHAGLGPARAVHRPPD